MQDRRELHTLVINALEEEIVIIDRSGMVIEVNRAWINFGVQNDLAERFKGVGMNYLDAVRASAANGDTLAADACHGIEAVISKEKDSFYLEYPCHSLDEKRWFMMRVADLGATNEDLYLISHLNITQRKLAEERAEHLSMHDPLTGLANRRNFDQFIKHEMLRCIRNRASICMVAIDVDHFKQYSDTLGHPAGDQCLIRVARVIESFARRPGDLAARLGGDEFALIMGETEIAGARNISAAIKADIKDLDLRYSETGKISVSIGVAAIEPENHAAVEELLRDADKELYQDKAEGRRQAAC